MFDLEQQAYDLGYRPDSVVEFQPPPEADATRPVVQAGFQLPAQIWFLMVGCYVIFFGAMAALSWASRFATFMVVISILYTVMFFATGSVLAGLQGPGGRSPLDRGQALPTWCGPMSRGAVYGQVLIVPAGIALFGASVALIGAVTG